MAVDWRAVGFCAICLIGCATAQSPVEVAATLNEAAEEIHELNPLDIANRPHQVASLARVSPKPEQNPIERLAATDYPTSALVPLLSDASPKVRTLALELLLRKKDLQLLPRVYRMAEDTGITFEHTVYYNFRANGPPDSKRETLTVGAYASAFLASFGVQGDFDKFWATHKDRAYWYGWLHAENLESEGQPARLKTLRERIEKFPEPDRSLYLIWLQSDFPTPLPATAAEITEAITRLGRGNIMALAELHMPADDPDLQFPANPGRFRYVTELILDHAQNVLTRADADRLSATYQQQRREFQDHHNARDNGPGVAYQILRARLMPDRASEILHEEIEARNGRFDGFSRDRLVAALFKLRGRAEMPLVREFFYGGGGKAVAALLESSDVALVDELLTDLRLGDLAPKDIAGLVETLPGIQQKLLVNWLYLQKENSPGFQNVQYFLRILNFTCNQSTYRAILLDPRLDKLSLSILFALEQETLSYKRPPEPRLTHDREIREYFALGSNKREPSAEAVAELVRFLRTVAPYVIAENITGGCWR